LSEITSCGVVVTRWVKSTKLLYGRPG